VDLASCLTGGILSLVRGFSFLRERSEIMKADEQLISAKGFHWREADLNEAALRRTLSRVAEPTVVIWASLCPEEELSVTHLRQIMLEVLSRQDSVVYAKHALGGPLQVLR